MKTFNQMMQLDALLASRCTEITVDVKNATTVKDMTHTTR